MGQPITLSIPEPCQEPWDAMVPTTAGRHCSSCQKVVQDFTQFSDAELVAWFAQATDGLTCGRLRDDQQHALLYANQPVKPGHIGQWVRWAFALVLGWQSARAQTSTTPAPPTTISPIGIKSISAVPQSEAIQFYVRGQVFYADGKPAHALIKKSTTGRFVFSDKNGQFAMPIYAADQRNNLLQLGFEDKKLTISTKYEQPPLTVTLGYCPRTISGGSIMVRRASLPKRTWWSMKRLFAKR